MLADRPGQEGKIDDLPEKLWWMVVAGVDVLIHSVHQDITYSSLLFKNERL